jgi:hypothetical protein
MMVPIGGGEPVALRTSGHDISLSSGLAVNSTNAFWNSSAGLMAVPLDGGTPTVISEEPSYHLTIDSKNAYWTDFGGAML